MHLNAKPPAKALQPFGGLQSTSVSLQSTFHLDGGAPGCGWAPGQVDAVQQVYTRRQPAVHLRLQRGVLRRRNCRPGPPTAARSC